MKIRTDFVTNSSSSSYVTVHIKNQVLCELLRDYKKKLGFASVSKDLIDFGHLEMEERDACFPSSYDQAVSKIWEILDKCSRDYPALYASLTNAKADIDSCFESILLAHDYFEWGGDGDLRFNWDFPKEVTQNDIDGGAVEETVYYYRADLRQGKAEETKGIHHFVSNPYNGLNPDSFLFYRIAYGNYFPKRKREFPVERVSVKQILGKYKKQQANVAIATNANATIMGKTFVITGDVHVFKNRNALKAYIESNGGKLSGSVSSKTDYLINNDINSTSSKNIAAKANNIPIITEDEFVARFNVQIG